ncbi:MAG: hypothetical protein H7Y15_03640 [Pseudonocardia sp.]|nr:hypothetical protein [Pseudonocardia sp.]
MTDRTGPTDDEASRALAELIIELKVCIDDLQHALERAEQLLEQRRGGRTWLSIISAESRPLIVERVSTTLESLATSGGRWRREEARALQAESVTITRIAELFGVTRQRISTLVRERTDTPLPRAGSDETGERVTAS